MAGIFLPPARFIFGRRFQYNSFKQIHYNKPPNKKKAFSFFQHFFPAKNIRAGRSRADKRLFCNGNGESRLSRSPRALFRDRARSRTGASLFR